MATIVPLKEVTLGHDTIEGFFPPAPEWVDQVSLDGSNASTYSVPTGARWLVLNSTATDWYLRADGNAAVVPAAGITNGTGSMLTPTQIDVTDVSSISLICASACYITISVYK